MARPTKLDPEAANAIVAILQKGLPIEDACEAAGISERAFHNWMVKGERAVKARTPRPEDAPFVQFMQAVKRARALGKVQHVDTIERAAIGANGQPADWKAAAWLLERMHPRQFGRKYIKIEGPDAPGLPDDGGPKTNASAPAPTVTITIEGNPEVPTL